MLLCRNAQVRSPSAATDGDEQRGSQSPAPPPDAAKDAAAPAETASTEKPARGDRPVSPRAPPPLLASIDATMQMPHRVDTRPEPYPTSMSAVYVLGGVDGDFG